MYTIVSFKGPEKETTNEIRMKFSVIIKLQFICHFSCTLTCHTEVQLLDANFCAAALVAALLQKMLLRINNQELRILACTLCS